jgi:hypothetical protein
VGDRPAVATMGDAAKDDPTLDRLGVHGTALRQLSDRKAPTNHGQLGLLQLAAINLRRLVNLGLVHNGAWSVVQ